VLESNWSAVDFDVAVVTRALTIQRSRVVVPVAFIGLAYFVFLGVWHAFAGPARGWGRGWYVVPLVTASGGAAGSLYLLWVMLFKLQAPCPLCHVIHAANGLLLVCTLCMWPSKRRTVIGATRGRSGADLLAHTGRGLRLGAGLRVTGFAVLVIAGLWVYRTAKLGIRREVAKLLPYKQFVEGLERDPDFLLREYYAQPQHAIPARWASNQIESRLSDATVVIFSDFGCSHCACFAGRWEREFWHYWQSPLRVSFRHLPMCGGCGQTVTSEGCAGVCRAAHAAEAARLQGGEAAFWRMHDLLFAQHRRLGEVSCADLATRIGLDGDKLVEDMNSALVRQAVQSDIALAAELGVRSTPAAFLNGRQVPRLCLNNPVFWEAIAAEIPPSVHVAAADSTRQHAGEEMCTDPAFAAPTVDP
jgi:hypothetical protein